MEHRYYFIIMWGQAPTESGESVASFQCGSSADLGFVNSDAIEQWDSYEGDGATETDGVEIWDRSNDDLTLILGRGNDLDAVSQKFFAALKKNFSGHLGV